MVKSTKVDPRDDDLECFGPPSSLCLLDRENEVGMYLGSQVRHVFLRAPFKNVLADVAR